MALGYGLDLRFDVAGPFQKVALPKSLVGFRLVLWAAVLDSCCSLVVFSPSWLGFRFVEHANRPSVLGSLGGCMIEAASYLSVACAKSWNIRFSLSVKLSSSDSLDSRAAFWARSRALARNTCALMVALSNGASQHVCRRSIWLTSDRSWVISKLTARSICLFPSGVVNLLNVVWLLT